MVCIEERNWNGWRHDSLVICRLFLVFVLLVVAGLQAHAAVPEGDPPGLNSEEKQALFAAVVRDDAVTVRAIVVAAVARDSSRLSGIVADVNDLAPEQLDMVVGQLGEIFPQLAARLGDIVAEVRSEAARRQPAEELPPETAETVPPKPAEGASGPWSGETVLGGSYRSVARSTTTANARFKLVHEADPWRNSAALEFDYGAADGATNDQRLLVSGRSKRSLGARLYGFGIASYEDDRFSGFDYQVAEGLGVGYRILDRQGFKLDLEGGPSLRQSRITENREFNHEAFMRVATNLTWHISDTATFTNETALFFSRNSVEVTSDVDGELRDGAESTNTSALDLQIVGNFGARVSFEIHYRSDPPPNGVPTETTSKVSLVHSF